LASVIASAPKVLLVDEPTQGVDVGARAEIYRNLRRIADQGVAILVVSSDATEIAGLCDRVQIFSRGTIVERLSGDEVSESAITGAVLRVTSVRERKSVTVSPLVSWAAGDWAPTVMVGIAVIVMGIVATLINPTPSAARPGDDDGP
jgi:ribose transport system ATP-binding protein